MRSTERIMVQKAKVTVIDGELATVEVSRQSICEGCHNMANSKGCSACLTFGDKIAYAKAYNTAKAKVGDRVTVSASSKRVIGYSAAIFFLPIVFSFIAYFLTEGVLGKYALAAALTVFVITFSLACIVLEKGVKKHPDLEIIAIDNGENE
ncbi:MAG: SoxR reducing system RseC family protein [Clostridia bacterium]|nr:SoxR reducing system RseC family protein [Clostridia bacterium]